MENKNNKNTTTTRTTQVIPWSLSDGRRQKQLNTTLANKAGPENEICFSPNTN